MASKEQEVYNEILKEAEADAKKPDPKGWWFGVAGIILGVIGMILPVGGFIMFPFVALCAVFANKHGSRITAAICGILSILLFI